MKHILYIKMARGRDSYVYTYLCDSGSGETNAAQSVHHIFPQPEVREAPGSLSLESRVLQGVQLSVSYSKQYTVGSRYLGGSLYDDGLHFGDGLIVANCSPRTYYPASSPVERPAQRRTARCPPVAHVAVRRRGCILNKAHPVGTI